MTVNEPHEPQSLIFSDPAWDGGADGSHAEIFGHIQLIGGAIALCFLWILRRASVYGAWALVFLVLVVDDLFQVHERWGAHLARAWSLPEFAGLRPQDYGELSVWAGLSLVAGVPLIIATLRASRVGRRHSLILLAATVVLAVFAVGVDMIHIMVHATAPPLVVTSLVLLETAGELIGMTLLMCAVQWVAVLPTSSRRELVPGSS